MGCKSTKDSTQKKPTKAPEKKVEKENSKEKEKEIPEEKPKEEIKHVVEEPPKKPASVPETTPPAAAPVPVIKTALAMEDDCLSALISDDINEHYVIGKEIGRGGFSIVRSAVQKSTGKKVAVKCIKKTVVVGDDIKMLRREIHIMKSLDHPNILKLFEVYVSDEEFFLVMELVEGRELFDKIVERGQYSEKDAANIVWQIVSGVNYLHQNGIAHRDLKPENLLCTEGEEHEVIKIADFGFAKNFGKENLMTSVGSPGYVAPEILCSESYNESVDMWSVGVIIYILLCGYPPFYADTASALYRRIMDAKYDFDDPSWDDVSESAKDLIRSLLVKDPTTRLTASQCLSHPWVLGSSASNNNAFYKLAKLKEYQSKRKLNQIL